MIEYIQPYFSKKSITYIYAGFVVVTMSRTTTENDTTIGDTFC